MLKRRLCGLLLVLGVVPFVAVGDRVEARMAAASCPVKTAPGEMLSIAYSAPSGSSAVEYDFVQDTMTVRLRAATVPTPVSGPDQLAYRPPSVSVGACTQAPKSLSLALTLTNASADDGRTHALRALILGCARGERDSWQQTYGVTLVGRPGTRPFNIVAQTDERTPSVVPFMAISVDMRSADLRTLICG